MTKEELKKLLEDVYWDGFDQQLASYEAVNDTLEEIWKEMDCEVC